tara:strand:- start:7498 stop:8229 length:732 start_codon:yes stop_codon:yes gene_type:complete
MDEIPIQEWACYADESSITKDKYSVVGCTVVRSNRLRLILDGLQHLREKHSMYAELKWSKVSNQKFDAYLDFVDFFFSMRERGYLAFYATTFDNHRWDHRKYNDGDPDIGLSKLYYQMLLRQYIRQYGDLASLYVCMDRRRSSTSFEDLQKILNAGAAKDYGLDFGPVRMLTARDSKKSDMLQINDIILGAVAAHKNGKHKLNDTRAAKRDLANRVAEGAGVKEYLTTGSANSSFSIWNFKPK